MQIDITTTFSRDKRVKMAYNVVVEADIYPVSKCAWVWFFNNPGGKYVVSLNINDNNIKNLIVDFIKIIKWLPQFVQHQCF